MNPEAAPSAPRDTRITYTEVCERGLTEEALGILREHLSTPVPVQAPAAGFWLTEQDYWDEVNRRLANVQSPPAEPQPKKQGWRPINTAPFGRPILAYAADLVDEDFNPSGVVDAYWQDDEGWIGGIWNGSQDCWDAQPIRPTHWHEKAGPAVAAPEDGERP